MYLSIQEILQKVIEEKGLINHPSLEGRFIYPDKKACWVTRFTIENLLKASEMCLDKTPQGFYNYFEVLLDCYVNEKNISKNNKFIPLGGDFVYSPYLEITNKF